ncbi:MAG TPA: ABC transporter substrate-binding protein [Candidatus Elarobacter sp.]|jgi:putative glutamine transport system substrate-binding protein
MNVSRLAILTASFAAAATLALAPALPARAADDNSLDAIKKRGVIKIGVKYDAPPFGSLNPQTNQVSGFDVDVARAIAKHVLGSADKVQLVQVKSDNRIPLVENGDIDAFVATATITPARMKTINFSNVYYRAGQSLLVKKGSPIKSYRDLEGKGVCSVQGSTPEQTIRRLVPKANVITFETYPECLTALRGGRIDAVTTDNVILGGYAAQDPNGLELVGGLFTFEPYGIGIKKGNDSLTKAINDTLADLKKNGEYAKIHEQWLHHKVPADFNDWFNMPAATAADKFASQKPG